MRILVYIAFVFLSCQVFGQDLHFSHYAKNPLYVNPALSGKFNGKIKLMSISRTQWSSVTVPYKSFGAMAEFASIGKSSPLGSAVSVYRDVAGDSRFTTTKVDAALSYSLPINYNNSNVLSFGMQAGIHHYALDYTKLQFDNQYDPDAGFNSSLPSREPNGLASVLSPAASAGVAFLKQGGRYVFVGGVGAYNLLQGGISFNKKGVDVSAQQNIRLNYYASVEYLSGRLIWVPSVLHTQSSVLHETILGLKARYQYDEYQPEFSAGFMYRWNDAIVATIGGIYGPWEAGFAYDFNVSTLNRASNGYGAVEFFLSYVIDSRNKAGSKKNRFQVCPSFI